MKNLIEIRNISASYDTKVVLKDVSLDIHEQDFMVVTGPNGGGKTTLMKVILGLMQPSSGELRFFDEGRRVKSLKMGYLPQMNPIDRQFPISVYDVVASGLAGEKPLLKGFSEAQKKRINEMIAQMGLERFASRAIGELSGGQFQRALLARAIVSSPKLLVLDEPNTYIDKYFEAQLYSLLERINSETAILLVSHNSDAVQHLAKQHLRID
ncbi:MAG: metal ABC transporter ATP-binding protein [Tannerella sp.]|jgi:zinc transport system ATP-binding protein|nr:metal ABC transporter ATP-binding protein [Tannerella sp.]